MKNVLVFSCGAIPAISINFALRGSDEYKVFGGSSYEDHGKYIYENYIGNMPFTYETDFVSKFNNILDKYNIDFIIPLHESMILTLQKYKNEIHAAIVSSGYDTALLCRYKSKTYQKLKGLWFIPKMYTKEDVKRFPVFVKKDDDQGGRKAYKVDTQEELDLYTADESMIICEYLPGEEITVDCFTDRYGQLRLCNPRVADRMLAGIDVHARRIPLSDEIANIAREINQHIAFRGPWFFQIKKDKNNKFKLLEISTRFAGAFDLTRCMDINTPLMAIRDFDNVDVDFDCNDLPIEADKMFIGRYEVGFDYDVVYIDGSATLAINSDVNPFMIMFLYQCRRKHKKVYLICEDEYEKEKLQKMVIPLQLFDLFLKGKPLGVKNAVCISLKEEVRKELRKSGIICYDPTAIEVLIDWKG